MKEDSGWKLRAALTLVFGLAALIPAAAFAQTAGNPDNTNNPPAPANSDQTIQLGNYIVTGSNIPNAGEALAIPVAVISPDQIQNSGIETDVLDVLRKISPAITGIGSENATLATSNTFGGSAALIHNLATLVLVNGRRMAYDPADAAGGLEFIDLNTIPLAAIDHIDVLSDGSSAIYGADAIGGVINIVLKKDFNGWEADAHYGYSDTTGHYSERSGSLTGGVSNGTTSITMSVEYTQSDPILESQRPYINPYYATTYVPGILEIYSNAPGSTYDEAFRLAPGLNAPPGGGLYSIQQLVQMGVYQDLGSFSNPGVLSEVEQIYNLADHETLQDSLKRQSVTLNFDHKFYDDKLQGFGTVLYSNTYTQSELNAQPIFPYVSDTNSDLANYGVSPPPAGTQIVPITAPTNPLSQASLDDGSTDGSGGYTALVHDRFENYPRLFQNDGDSFTVVGGLRGQINEDWSWEAAADINDYRLYYTNPNLLDLNNLIAAFQNGTVNPFAITQTPGALDGIIGTGYVNFNSTLNSFDAVVRGALFELPAGKVQIAVGGQYQRENLTAQPDNNTENGLWVDSPTIAAFNSNRSIASVYGELEVPIVDKTHPLPGVYSLNIDGAERYDDYSGNVGSSTVPKVDVKWQPYDDEFTLRFSAGKSFIAPTLYDLYGPVTHGASDLISYTGYNGVQYSSVQFNDESGANPDLKPSTASTWSTGFVFTPNAVKGLSLTWDYYQVVQHQLVGSVDQTTIVQSVEDLGAASPYASYVHFGSFTGPGPSGDTPGQISERPLADIYLVTPNVNIGAQAVKGWDAALAYSYPTDRFGKFEFTTAATIYDSYMIQVLPTENYYQYAGHVATNAEDVEGVGGTTPRYRLYSTLEWQLKGVDTFLGQTFVPSVTDIGPGGVDEETPLHVPSYVQYDFAIGYHFANLHLGRWLDGFAVRVGVNNAFNYEPPVAPYRLIDTLADLSTYDGAVGRMFFVDGQYKF